jgi:hypothetical protein
VYDKKGGFLFQFTSVYFVGKEDIKLTIENKKVNVESIFDFNAKTYTRTDLNFEEEIVKIIKKKNDNDKLLKSNL